MSERIGIIGGGIIGLSIAYELEKQGFDCTLFEKNTIGSGTTLFSGGMLAPLSESFHQTNSKIVDLGIQSLQRYFSLEEELLPFSKPFRFQIYKKGFFNLEFSEIGHSMLEAFYQEMQKQKGISVSFHNTKELLQELPFLAKNVLSGIYSQECWIHPDSFVKTLALSLQKTKLLEQTEVLSLRRQARGFELTTQDKKWEMDQVVLCGGVWSDSLYNSLGYSFEMKPIRGQILRYASQDISCEHVVRCRGTYLIPQHQHGFYVGATSEDVGFSTENLKEAQQVLLEAAQQISPVFAEKQPQDSFFGFRPCSKDREPIVGELEKGLWIATCHYRNGILFAPITALMISKSLCGEKESLWEVFSPHRKSLA